MARFYGKVGYGESIESPEGSGIWVDEITLIDYYGDVIRDTRRLQDRQVLNDDILVNNSISIVADDYAISHFFNIRFVEWAGAFWTVTTVENKPPRLILTLGSIYNGPTS